MSTSCARQDEVTAALGAEFPRWRVFRSSAGRLWATRLGWNEPPRGWQRDPDLKVTVDADTAEELRTVLSEQDALLPLSGARPGSRPRARR